ncbi:phosphoribosyltransferase [Candidatus Bathyarchaeota archaeon]|nr:phosphoribosyltransferase [Candidatus Bathyarchaeota archaeon]
MEGKFKDRVDAGKQLAGELEQYQGKEDAIVLALPRGGLPVAHEIASHLQLPLDIIIVRKLGTPRNPEVAMGAIGPHRVTLWNEDIIHQLGITEDQKDRVRQSEMEELQRRQNKYRQGREDIEVEGKTVILVDDGVATGATMKAAIQALKKLNAGKIIAAIPTAPADTYREIGTMVDQIKCLMKPTPFFAVGAWYNNFSQVNDGEVIDILSSYHE